MADLFAAGIQYHFNCDTGTRYTFMQRAEITRQPIRQHRHHAVREIHRRTAFARLAGEGSTPDIEQAIDTSLRRTRPFVIVIWACLIGAAAVGVIKPAL